MIVPKVTDVLLYLSLSIAGLAGLLFFQAMLIKLACGVVLLIGIACLIISKSWRTVAVVIIELVRYLRSNTVD
ncbi:hypothetical protein DTL42_00430 [Bremerella cremea]|uniref:Uncharacterized protein n=1 Tax=Bremerella cremea TaxID=1031537 RepID=A0A368KXR7_9BACT|nr:hypothetical protein DTL42_00430 [Bremerella cremea]